MTTLCYNPAMIFKEEKLGKDFCSATVVEINELIEDSTCFTVVGMRSVGVSMLIYYLATLDLGKMIHLDINELPQLTKFDFFKLLNQSLGGKDFPTEQELLENCRLELTRLVKSNKRVVIL